MTEETTTQTHTEGRLVKVHEKAAFYMPRREKKPTQMTPSSETSSLQDCDKEDLHYLSYLVCGTLL